MDILRLARKLHDFVCSRLRTSIIVKQCVSICREFILPAIYRLSSRWFDCDAKTNSLKDNYVFLQQIFHFAQKSIVLFSVYFMLFTLLSIEYTRVFKWNIFLTKTYVLLFRISQWVRSQDSRKWLVHIFHLAFSLI